MSFPFVRFYIRLFVFFLFFILLIFNFYIWLFLFFLFFILLIFYFYIPYIYLNAFTLHRTLARVESPAFHPDCRLCVFKSSQDLEAASSCMYCWIHHLMNTFQSLCGVWWFMCGCFLYSTQKVTYHFILFGCVYSTLHKKLHQFYYLPKYLKL